MIFSTLKNLMAYNQTSYEVLTSFKDAHESAVVSGNL